MIDALNGAGIDQGAETVGLGRRLSRSMVAIAAALSMVVGPMPVVRAQTTPSGDITSAQKDGEAFAKSGKEGAASIPDQEVNGDVIPGYSTAPSDLSNLFGSDDGALNSAGGSAVGNEAWEVMMGADANRGTVDPASFEDIIKKGEEINENAGSSELGGNISNTPGTCEEVKVGEKQDYYDATCDVGVTVTTPDRVEELSCPDGYTLVGRTCSKTLTQPADVTYTCPDGGVLQGTTCVVTQPASVSSHSCPAGFSLQGTNCVRTTTEPAVITGYSCPSDYMLEGDRCVRTLEQSATPNYNCPAGYVLEGTTCRSKSTYAATASYSCPAGYSLSGTTCSRTLSQPADVYYTCPAGYDLNGTTCTQTGTYTAVPNYSCPSGYTLSGTTCTATGSYGATPNYSCPNGGTLQGTECVTSGSYAATASYSCPNGGTLNGTNCMTTSQTPGTPVYQCSGWAIPMDLYTFEGAPYCGMAKTGKTCPTGWIGFYKEGKAQGYSGTKCFFHPKVNYTCPGAYVVEGSMCTMVSATPGTVSYSCPNGGTLNGTTCQTSSSSPATITYSCPSGGTLAGNICNTSTSLPATVTHTCPNGGTLNGTTCTIVTSTSASPVYYCPSGYNLSGTTCSRTEESSATVTYSCPNGGSLSGSVCTIDLAQPADVTYSCPSGWQVQGDKCRSVLSQPATPIYSCPSGYSLSGNMCSKTETQPATPNYSCPTDFTLSGTTCTKTYPAQPNYSCPANYTLSGTTCSMTLSLPATVTMVCPPGATEQNGTCYGESTGQSECAELEANPKCSHLRDTCLDEEPNGPCKVMERTFKCPIPNSPPTDVKEYVCGGSMYCINGSCSEIEDEASNEFKDALVAMGAIDQVGKEFDPDTLGLFKGTRETCHKPVFGLVNCCAGKVSGLFSGGVAAAAAWAGLSGGPAALAGVATQFLTTFLCSNEEKQLDVKDRLGLCVSIGSYCSSSFLGVCQTKRKAYCCFESKLTRILQEQGRPQINKPWDKPKEEQCKGFTVEEFSRLDLSKMDFSDIYADFLEAVKLPDEAQMASDIQAKIDAYYKQHGPGGN